MQKLKGTVRIKLKPYGNIVSCDNDNLRIVLHFSRKNGLVRLYKIIYI